MPRATAPRRRQKTFSPRAQFGVPAALAVALGTTVGHWGFHWAWLWSYLAAVNLVTLLLYGYDKRAAAYGGPRVPERVLHAAAIAGGTPAAYLGQRLFRHKTIKGSAWLQVAAQGVRKPFS